MSDQPVKYKYLEVIATVNNRTAYDMILKTVHLEWGKFIEGKSPINVPAHGVMNFSACGRDSSISGTEGYIEWTIPQHPQDPTIKATFDNPAVGKCKASITCDPECVAVNWNGKSANSFHVTYTIG